MPMLCLSCSLCCATSPVRAANIRSSSLFSSNCNRRILLFASTTAVAYKHSCTTGRRAVNQAVQFTAVLRLYRHNKSAVTHSYNRRLQDFEYCLDLTILSSCSLTLASALRIFERISNNSLDAVSFSLLSSNIHLSISFICAPEVLASKTARQTAALPRSLYAKL